MILFISSCNQNSPAPASSSSTSPTPTPTSNFTSADSAISGNWILDLTELYSIPSGTLISSQPHSDPANCHLNLQLAVANGYSPSLNYKQCVYGLGCSPTASVWRLNAGDLELANALYIIISQTPTNLVLELSNGSGKMKCYLHK